MPGVRKLFSRPENVRHAAQGRDRLQHRYRLGSGGRAAKRRRTETATGPNQFARAWKNISRIASEAGARRGIWKTECRSSRKTSCGIERKRPPQWGDGFD